MPKARLSNFRSRIVRFVKAGNSISDTAKEHDLNRETVARWRDDIEKQGISKAKRRGAKSGNGKISREALQQDKNEYRHDSDSERARRLGVHRTTITRAMRRWKIKYQDGQKGKKHTSAPS